MNEYPDQVAFYPAETGGSYNASRVFQPSSTSKAAAWCGRADVQDRGRVLKRDRSGDVLFDFDAEIFFREADEAAALAVLEQDMKVTTPNGTGRVVMIDRLSGTVYVKYGR